MEPMPNVDDPATREFWRGTRESKIVVQRCLECGYLRWPPGPLCPECQSGKSSWEPIAPRGTLWSYATYHRALDPAFAEDIPYTVGLVELQDGPRMYGRMLGDLDLLEPGIEVSASFQEMAPDIWTVAWTPAQNSDPSVEHPHTVPS